MARNSSRLQQYLADTLSAADGGPSELRESRVSGSQQLPGLPRWWRRLGGGLVVAWWRLGGGLVEAWWWLGRTVGLLLLLVSVRVSQVTGILRHRLFLSGR